ncbi:MmcQ/YjbR family DNA-binding protein [Niabella beijingensis]|uniref:MmcQ/YjbR family DNA-binding protein n=1 Tax=Niabella beijingensis TaxID=2872700 RepID=UPI001CC0F2F6|nr:MmcQ/YjbR family DNA-binding protein [Niabella beijingensis]MBZ4190326.1 MmcQ/YjbR family DNA-binding protein [Niabella beijingensis]
MISEKMFMEMALSFPGTEAYPHFDRIGLKVTGRRMFASYWAKDNTTNIFLTTEEQRIFCEMDPEHVYPVPNKWGEKGATTFVLDTVAREIVMEALLSAYNEIMQTKKRK